MGSIDYNELIARARARSSAPGAPETDDGLDFLLWLYQDFDALVRYLAITNDTGHTFSIPVGVEAQSFYGLHNGNTSFIPIVNGEGNLASGFATNQAQQLLVLSDSTALVFPTGISGGHDFQIGNLPRVGDITSDVDSDGNPVDRAVLDWGETPTKLASAVVDGNSGTDTTLLTVPTGRKLYVTRLFIHDPSAAGGACVGNVGYNSSAYDNVASAIAMNGLTAATDTYLWQSVKVGAKRGAAGADLKWHNSTLQGSAFTFNVDVFGFYR